MIVLYRWDDAHFMTGQRELTHSGGSRQIGGRDTPTQSCAYSSLDCSTWLNPEQGVPCSSFQGDARREGS